MSKPMFRAMKLSPALSGDAEGRGAEVWLMIGFSTRVYKGEFQRQVLPLPQKMNFSVNFRR